MMNLIKEDQAIYLPKVLREWERIWVTTFFIILLWGWGEHFLNKDIYEMSRLPRNRGRIQLPEISSVNL
jgi:hypothetical protein